MATKVLVNGKFQTRPGVYATIKSGVINPPVNLSYGNILIIDDGIGADWGGGSGINGTFKNGIDSIKSFDSIQTFRAFVKGGELWNLAQPLFNPSGSLAGVSKIFLARAATTTPAEIEVTLTNGAFTLQTKDEGVNANGVLDDDDNLSIGYAGKLIRVNIPQTTATFVTTTTQASGVSTPQINKVVATNINIGDVFSVTVGGNTVTRTATSTLSSELYTALAAALNANVTIAAAITATVDVTGLIITADANNTPFTQTSSVTAAPAQFIFQIWTGTYKGLDTNNNVSYDGVESEDTKPQLIIQSPVVTAVQDLLDWFSSSQDFNEGFVLKSGSTASGNIVVADLVTYPDYILASGGTESYGSTDFDDVLGVINNLDFTFFLGTKYGNDAKSLNNTKIFDFINNDSKYERFLVIGGGYDKDSFDNGSNSSTGIAVYYNSDKVIVVHGGVKKSARTLSGFNTYSQLYKAAQILGRISGLEPQVPVTLKSVSIDGEIHPLSDAEQEIAIAKGVLYTYYDYELQRFVVGQDINTLQKNEYLINEDNTSFNIALKRIEAFLNKSIMIDGKIRFFGGNNGGNRNTTSPSEVIAWAEAYLKTKTATSLSDNLIIKAQNIQASIQEDNLFLNYEFVPNTEISKIIVTGTLIEG
jgi:hypothetical protein